MRRLLLTAALAFGALSPAAASQAQPPEHRCFFISQWQSWKAPDEHTIYIKVQGRGIYRLDVANGCPELMSPGAYLVSVDHRFTVCEPIDWQLRVSQGGISSACNVTGMSLLTPDEAAALPRDARP
jgi:opacity protein-like surface antigen